MKKAFTKVFVSLFIVCTIVLLSFVNAGATQSKINNFNKNYSLSGNHASDIATVAEAQIGKKGSQFGYTEHWCADFVSDCARSAGISTSVIPYTGGVSNMYSAMMSSGASVVSSAKRGDLVFYKNASGWCHVAIMLDSVNSVHGNVNGDPKSDSIFWSTSKVTKCKYNEYKNGSATFVRPNYSNSDWKSTASKVDLGNDFYGVVYNNARNKVLTVETNNNNNVAMYSYTGATTQIWHFKKNSDGTYAIKNCANGLMLDVNGGGSGWANIQTYSANTSGAQKWRFYGNSSEMFISAECNKGVLDVANAKYDEGTNLTINTKSGNNAQIFSVKKLDSLGTPALAVSTGSTVKFSWSAVKSATSYTLYIYKNSNASGSAYITKKLTGTSVSVKLDAGNYSAVLLAKNAYSSKKSAVKTFTVNGSSSSDGWTYANSLPSGVTSSKYTIQYKHVYTKTAKTSPGDGWVKGAVAKTEYVKKGSTYTSGYPLTTSKTRVLVDYYYYHFCSGSTGSEVNFAQTNKFTHYDGISKTGLTEVYQHQDYDDSRYTFYRVADKNGNIVGCKSGVSCDGSYGSHGVRSDYWYKMYVYQDKEAVNYYKFTKQGSWTSSKDSSASSYTVRYKKKAACSKHSYSSTVTKATLSNNGKITKKCKNCSATTTSTIYKISSVKLSETSYIYNGKVKTPSVTVKDSKGKVLKKDTDYKVTYTKGRAAVGKYVATITFKGNYSGTKTISFTILPSKTSKITVAQTTTTLKATWNKVTGATGYRVQLINANGKVVKTVTTKNLTYTFSKLTAGTTYKVKVTAYKTISGANKYSTVSTTLATATKPATPKLTLSSKTKGIANLSWTNIAGENGYQVYYSTSKNGTYSKVGSYSANKTSLSKSKLTSGKTYYFKVRAYKKVGNTVVYSDWTSVKSVKIK